MTKGEYGKGYYGIFICTNFYYGVTCQEVLRVSPHLHKWGYLGYIIEQIKN